MKATLLILATSCHLMAGTGVVTGEDGGRESTGNDSLVTVLINDLVEDRRIAVSVINVRATNIRLIHGVDHAVKMGDATVAFERDGVEYRRDGQSSQLIPGLVDWYPGGQGFTQAKRKENYVAAFGLASGCYKMRVSYSNVAAVRAPTRGSPGPTTKPAVTISKVCFDDRDIANASALGKPGQVSGTESRQ